MDVGAIEKILIDKTPTKILTGYTAHNVAQALATAIENGLILKPQDETHDLTIHDEDAYEEGK